jgi:hypothetical protein
LRKDVGRISQKGGDGSLIFRGFGHLPDQPLVEGAVLRDLPIGFRVFRNEKNLTAEVPEQAEVAEDRKARRNRNQKPESFKKQV